MCRSLSPTAGSPGSLAPTAQGDHHPADTARADPPDAGNATIAGTPYPDLTSPAQTVGALLDAAAHPEDRAGQLLAMVGLQPAARQRAGGYPLGMRQRLGLTAALLGDRSCWSSTSPPTA